MSELGDTRSIHRKRSSQNCLHNGTGNLLCPSRELNPLIREAFHRIREDRIVRTNLPKTNDLTSLLVRSEGPVTFSKRINGRVSATWEVKSKTLDGEDQPNGLQVKATCRQNRRTNARCAIVALAAYPPTPLAEMR
jgi:hypothetical protein